MNPLQESNSKHPRPANAAVTSDRQAWWRTPTARLLAGAIGVVVVLLVVCLFALIAAYRAGHQRGTESADRSQQTKKAETVWTCSMHPEVALPEPGLCPICNMDLIPRAAAGHGEQHSRELVMTEAAVALAQVPQ